VYCLKVTHCRARIMDCKIQNVNVRHTTGTAMLLGSALLPLGHTCKDRRSRNCDEKRVTTTERLWTAQC
jgi:hypothetical protein